MLVQEGEIAKVGAGLCLIEVDETITGDDLPVEAVSITNESKQEEVVSTRHPHPLDPANTLQGKSVNSDNVFAAPSVRHFARKNGVDLSSLVPGTGKGGRIEKGDVEAYLTQGRASSTKNVSETDQLEDVVVELGRTRYGMWKAMVKVRCSLNLILLSLIKSLCIQSLEIPHFGYFLSLGTVYEQKRS